MDMDKCTIKLYIYSKGKDIHLLIGMKFKCIYLFNQYLLGYLRNSKDHIGINFINNKL